MAELVEKYIEELCQSYSVLRKTELFSEDELRNIVKIHHGLLYKAARKQKRPVDFMAIMHFEMQMHKLIRKRRQTSGYIFCPSLEKNLLQRVKRLNRALCFRFPGEPEHWIMHLALLHHLGQYKAIDRLLGRLLQQHTDKPDIWIAAGRWFMNGRVHLRMELRKRARQQRLKKKEAIIDVDSDVEDMEVEEMEDESEKKIRVNTIADGIVSGRETFLKGIKMNPGSADLLVDYFAFELDAADFRRWRSLTIPVAEEETKEKVEEILDARLAGLVWGTIELKYGGRLDVVERCAELIRCVGWVREEPWTKEVFKVYRSLIAASEGQESSIRRPVPKVGPTPRGDPKSQVAEFADALQKSGNKGARKVWHDAIKQGWATVELFLAYTTFERNQFDVDARADDIRLQCERMAALAGGKSPEFWLEFVKLEESWNPASAGLIDWRARKTLRGSALTTYAAKRAAAAFITI